MPYFRGWIFGGALITAAMAAMLLTAPDRNSAKLAMEAAGYDRVRVQHGVIPCRAGSAIYLHGIIFMVYMEGANRRNTVCHDRRTGEWILTGKFEGL